MCVSLCILMLLLIISSRAFYLEEEYRILGVQENDGIDVIKRNHRKLAMDNHPDKHPNCADCVIKLQTINNAVWHIDLSPSLDCLVSFRKRAQ